MACALTQSSEEWRQSIKDFKEELQALDFAILEFFDLKAGTPPEVTRYDLEQVRNCDLMVAIADEPSLGLGAELMYRVAILAKPALVFVKNGYYLSRFILGMPSLYPDMEEVKRYHSLQEVPVMVKDYCWTKFQRPALTIA